MSEYSFVNRTDSLKVKISKLETLIDALDELLINSASEGEILLEEIVYDDMQIKARLRFKNLHEVSSYISLLEKRLDRYYSRLNGRWKSIVPSTNLKRRT